MTRITESQLRKIIREEIINEMIPRKVDRVQQTSMPKQDIVQTQEQISKSDPRWRAVRTWLGKDEYKRRYFEPERMSNSDPNNRYHWNIWGDGDPKNVPLLKLAEQIKQLFQKKGGVKDTFMRMVIAADKFGFESEQFQTEFDANTEIVAQIEPIMKKADAIVRRRWQKSIENEEPPMRGTWGHGWEPDIPPETSAERDSRLYGGHPNRDISAYGRPPTADERDSRLWGGHPNLDAPVVSYRRK